MDKILNEENISDQNVDSDATDGPAYVITKEEVVRAWSKMRHGTAAGQSGVVNEMLEASGESE